MSPTPRLERAMEVFLECKERGLDRQTALAAHPELADLLQTLFDDASDGTAASGTFGDYRLVREVGRGSMGVVYEAMQLSLERRVALKVLAEAIGGNPTQVARFRREALTLARLDHPHVVRVFDVGETDGRHWLAMEFIDGETLDQRIAALRLRGGHEGGSLRDAVQAIAEIAEALQHVHDTGVLHRDVKPSNVLLRRHGGALLSDFGLARDDHSPGVTQIGVIAGTPHYMSPEHLAGDNRLTPASDVFSLGAALYEAITLHRPFEGDSSELVLQQILNADPPDPRTLHKGLNVDLAAIVLKALEKDPARRYATAAAFAEDLRAFLDLRPVQARAPSSTQRLRRWARRQPLKAALALSLLVAATLGGYVLVQMPELQAAARARRDQQYEDAITAGLLARTSRLREPCYASFARAIALQPERGEAIAALSLAKREFEGPEAALAELQRWAGQRGGDEVIERARQLLLQRLGRTAEAALLEQQLGQPTTAAGLWFAASARVVGVDMGDANAKRALALIALAKDVSPQPRLLLYSEWASIAHDAGDAAAMQESQQALLRLWPDHPYALHFAAFNLARSDLPRAIELCKRSGELGMDEPQHLFLLTHLLAFTDRHAEVVAACRAALRFPFDDSKRSKLILALGQHGADDGRREEAERWLQESPTNLTAMRQVAVWRAEHAQDDAALPLFRQIAASLPGDVEAQYNFATALHLTFHDAEATAQLRRVIVLDGRNDRAHRRLLDLLDDDKAGDGTAALQECRRYVAARPEDAGALAELAERLLLATSAHRDAALDREAIETATMADYLASGRDAAILELRARIHDLLGENAAASRCRERAAALPKAGK